MIPRLLACSILWISGVTCTFPAPGIASELFGRLPDGSPVTVHTLRNSAGAEVRIITYGGVIVSLKVPDRDGKLGDVVLGFDKWDDYAKNSPYFGAIIGRYGNRIAGGKFSIDGKAFEIVHAGAHALHGGSQGFDKVIWTVDPAIDSGTTLVLKHLSKDGDQGFPGNLTVETKYTLGEDNSLTIDFTATTDATTICNLTHHSYFNLAGRGDILGHRLALNADRFTPIDSESIPTGELRAVVGTPFDFTQPAAIGARINADDEQLRFARGYDHNWVLNRPASAGLIRAATVSDPESGRVLEVWTTAPGIQFYTGNYLNGMNGKDGRKYQPRQGFCLEPQDFPDAPNHASFPSPILRPGETYRHTIVYRFSVAPR